MPQQTEVVERVYSEGETLSNLTRAVFGLALPRGHTQNKSRAEELGADEFIPKPVTFQEIAQRLGVFQSALFHVDGEFEFRHS